MKKTLPNKFSKYGQWRALIAARFKSSDPLHLLMA